MSNSPSATLCYGINLFAEKGPIIPIDKICELMDSNNGEITIESYGFYEPNPGHILSINKLKTWRYATELSKYLPLTESSWDAKLKEFCKANKIPFSQPQWWLLAYYG